MDWLDRCSCCDGSGWKHGREDVINDEQGIVWRDVDEECDCECHGEPAEQVEVTPCPYCGGSDGTHHATCPAAQTEQLEEQRLELLAAEASVSHLMALLVVERAREEGR